LAARSGVELWRSITREAVSGSRRSFIDLQVAAAAQRGGVVLLSGEAGHARRLARLLPRPREWPAQLGPGLHTELILALDARSGRPRWTELGGQPAAMTLSDRLTCEAVALG